MIVESDAEKDARKAAINAKKDENKKAKQAKKAAQKIPGGEGPPLDAPTHAQKAEQKPEH